MKLTIKKCSRYPISKSFIRFLKERACMILITILDKDQLKRWDNYLSKCDLGCVRKKDGRYVVPSAYNILISGICNIKVRESTDSYELYIDPNAVLSGTAAKIIEIVGLINAGNVEMPPYPVYDRVWEQLKRNFISYYLYYYGGI